MGEKRGGGVGGKKKQLIEGKLSAEALESMMRSFTSRRNKMMILRKLKKENKAAKSRRRRGRQSLEAQGKQVSIKPTKTVETMRKADATLVTNCLDEEIIGEERVDEFSEYFEGSRTPKLLVTTVMTNRPSRGMIRFLKELLLILPNTYYYKRQGHTFDKVVKFANSQDFTDVMVFNQHNGKPSGLYVCHLPEGPTSYFTLTGLKLAQDLKGGGVVTDHKPEIVLNNFDTRLGRRVGRQIAALFAQSPEFEGRRVITFHNQRDFVFFRHHRYVFKDKAQIKDRKKNNGSIGVYEENGQNEPNQDVRCYLKEIGPRFTLKLKTMQLGIFDDLQGLYEFVWRADSQADRKTFFI